MRIENEKTGVIYQARTMKELGAFVSIVTKRAGNTATLASKAYHPTRNKAYKFACDVCKSLADNHAYIN
jgi:ABC-type molybdate transport system permease subunit